MLKKRDLRLATLTLLLGFSLFTLGGCGISGAPVEVTLNGYTVDRATGTAYFNLSAFDASSNLITTGVIENPSITVNQALDASGNELGNVSATARVCGDIVSHDAITAVVTLDATGSMADNDPNNLRSDAAKAFIDRLGVADLAAVASFDTDTAPTPSFSAIHVWQNFTNDKTLLYTAIDAATFAGGGTNLWDAIIDDVNLLLTETSGAEKVALVLTDGEDTDSLATSSGAATYAADNGVKVYMIGLGDPQWIDFSEMQDVARQTGGLFAAANDPAQLEQLFDGMFNATKASFCIEATFLVDGAPPAPGTTIRGSLTFTLNGREFSVDYTVTF